MLSRQPVAPRQRLPALLSGETWSTPLHVSSASAVLQCSLLARRDVTRRGVVFSACAAS